MNQDIRWTMVLQVTCEQLAYIPLLFASELRFGSFDTRDVSRCIIFSTPSKCSHTTCGYNNHTFTTALPGLDQLYHSTHLYLTGLYTCTLMAIPYCEIEVFTVAPSWDTYYTRSLWVLWSGAHKLLVHKLLITLNTLMSVYLSVCIADISLKLLQTYGHIRKHSLHC